MKTKYMTLALSGLVAGLCLSVGNLSAWERSAMSDCKKDMDQCKKNVDLCKKDSSKTSDDCKSMMDDCKKDMDQCKKNVDKNDGASFERQLNSYNQNRFVKFSSDQKVKAMDMADKNRMDPNDAVDKVAMKK